MIRIVRSLCRRRPDMVLEAIYAESERSCEALLQRGNAEDAEKFVSVFSPRHLRDLRVSAVKGIC